MKQGPQVDPAALCFQTLKGKQRKIRHGFPESLALRVHRAISWLGRAEQETDDTDVQFILLWIGFNAAYASDLREEAASTRGAFKDFFEALCRHDKDKRIYELVWSRFSQEIRLLISNRHVFAPFWHNQNGLPGYEDWEERLIASKNATGAAVVNQDTARILSTVFDRLYVLRNQLVHGGSTWHGGVNRDQVRDGAAVLGRLLPVFIDVMMDNPHNDWGKPYYPVVT